MPHITTAMRRSVRRGAGDIVIDSLLGKRAITDSVNNVKTTFSSWDNCMKQTYCKWPVIAAMVIGGLIVFSILWCIIRCACCGMSCCCTCFSFLKCCDCCGGACDGKKNKPHKHLDDPFSQAPRTQGYQAPSPMGTGAAPQQFAQFEVGKNGFAVEKPGQLNEDALPPMPSWDTAAKKHIPTEEEKNAVELGELDPVTGQKIPLMMTGGGAVGTAPPSPLNDPAHSPYGPPPGQAVGGGGGYMGVAGDAYALNNQSQTSYDPFGKGQRQRDNPSAMGRGGGGYNSNQDPYSAPGDDTYNANSGGYGRAQPERQYSNGSRGLHQQQQQQQYPPRQPTRQYSNDSRPSQQRQYTDQSYQSDSNYTDPYQQSQSRGPSRAPRSPLNNNSGFDFGGGGGGGGGGSQGGYAHQQRPPAPSRQQESYNSYQTANSYNTRSQSPAPQEMDGGYTVAPQMNYRGPPPRGAYGGGGGGGGGGGERGAQDRREPPQNWDPVQR